jgi:Protein of unknown function (DUF2975)
MKHGSTLFLKGVILLLAMGALAGLVRFPQTEGRATNLDLVSVYKDPVIIYVYIASSPFFVALYQAFKLLGYVDKSNTFAQSAVDAVKNIKHCALAIVGFLVVALFALRVVVHGDDPAGPTTVGVVAMFTSLVIAIAAGVFQKLLQHAVDIKSENDLTV